MRFRLHLCDVAEQTLEELLRLARAANDEELVRWVQNEYSMYIAHTRTALQAHLTRVEAAAAAVAAQGRERNGRNSDGGDGAPLEPGRGARGTPQLLALEQPEKA